MNIKEQEIVEKHIAEASTADYARLSDKELKDLLRIFADVSRAAAKPVVTAITRELSKRRIREGHDPLEEAKIVPFKKLEQAWTRTNGDKDKQAKLIKKHDLKQIISTVRPGEIKLGVKNKLLGTTKAATAAGLDLDDELIFITNNPLKIIYPKKSTRRPEGEEIKEEVKVKKDLDTLRLEKVVSLTLKHDNMEVVEKFVASSNIDLDSTATEIKEATSGVKWVIYDEKTGKLLNKGKSYTTWKGAKSAAAKLPGKALPTDAAWYHDNKAKLMGEATDLEEAVVYRDIVHALRLLTDRDGIKVAGELAKKDQDAKISSSDLKKAKEVFSKMNDKDTASIAKKKNDKYFPKFGVKALTEESVDLEEGVAYVTNGKKTYMFNSTSRALDMYDSLGGSAKGWKVVTDPSKIKGTKVIKESVKWWTVTITKKAGKLFKGQTVDVKANNSAEAIKKGIKQMKGDPVTVPSGSVDAVLGESLEEAAKPSNGKSTVGLDVVDAKSAMKDMKKFNLKTKEGKGNGSADEVIVTGKNVDIFKYLRSKAYNMDTDEIEEFYPELFESVELGEAIKVKTHRGMYSIKKGEESLKSWVEKIVIMSDAVKKNQRSTITQNIVKAIESGKIKNADLTQDLGTLIGVKAPSGMEASSSEVKSKLKNLKLLESTDLEEAVSQADIKKILAAAKKAGGDIKGNQIDFGMGAVIDVSIEKGKIKLDAGKSNGVEYFKTAKDAVMAFESVDFDLEEAFSRLPGHVINNELYVANNDLQAFVSSQRNGNDVDIKKLNQLIKALQAIKKEVKQFNNPEDVPLKYQYKSK